LIQQYSLLARKRTIWREGEEYTKYHVLFISAYADPDYVARDQQPGATVPVAVSPPSMLRGKTIEEIVNRWSSELDNHAREFNKFAGEVAVWDRALIENGNSVSNSNGSRLIPTQV
jgi:hypothetical protein